MKIRLLASVFLLSSVAFFAQDTKDKKIYLDSLWTEVPEGKHQYFRIVKDYYSENSSFTVMDYYKSGAIQMEGTFLDKEAIKKNGSFTFYHENGNRSSVMNYNNSLPVGPYTCWYENGQKKLEGEYLKSKINEQDTFSILQFWDDKNIQKVINGNGHYTNLDLKRNLSETGKIKNGLKDSIWTGSDGCFKFSYTEKYKNGKLLSGISIDSNTVEHKYTEMEIRPRPKKGLQHFYKYISKKLTLPKENIQGKILLSFIVNKDGSIDEVTVKKSLREDIDQEAVKTVSSYSDWEPGKMRGIDVRVLYTIPISIVQ